ncbi:hypothetical protein MXB_1412, partial [Myxobolus squamalis]
LKEEVLSLAACLRAQEESVHVKALSKLVEHCKSDSISMSELPKHITFLFDQIDELKDIYKSWGDDYEPKKDLANVISALSFVETESLECLKYRRLGRQDANNCEVDAVDLFLDLNYHEQLDEFVDETNINKICLYLKQCTYYMIKEDFLEVNRFLYCIYLRFHLVIESFMASCRALDVELFHDILLKIVDEREVYQLSSLDSTQLQLQLCYMLAHYGIYYCFSEEHEVETTCKTEELIQLIQNRHLINAHIDCANELDLSKPYSPDDVCRITNHKHTSFYTSGNTCDPSRVHMAYAFVSGLINAAFKCDTLMLNDPTYKWLISGKERPLMNTVACTGLLYMWDVDEAMLMTEKFLFSSNRYVKAGGILAIGISAANVMDPFSSHYAILSEYLTQPDILFKRNAIISLGLAYAGTDNFSMADLLKVILLSEDSDSQTKALCSLSIGMIACGTNLPTLINKILIAAILSLKDKFNLNHPYMRLIPLGLGLIYAGRFETIQEDTKELYDLPGNLGKWCHIIIKICSNVGSGNATAIQKLIKFINEPETIEKTKSVFKFSDTIVQEPPIVKSSEQPILSLSKAEDLNPEESTTISKTDGESLEETKDVIDVKQKKEKRLIESMLSAPDHEKDVSLKAKITNLFDVTSKPKIETKKIHSENFPSELLQGLATIGVAIISLGDQISQKMALHLYNTFLQFGSLGVRRAVPVGLGILSASNPQISIIEILSKLSHDSDAIIACNAIIGLGMVAAGTNNSRVSNLLRNLNVFYYNESQHLFAVRLAQGLVHLGKGLMTMSPSRCEGDFLSPVSISSLIIHAVLSLDVTNTYLSIDPHMFFWLVPCMKFRGLVTYDKDMKMIPVSVRVGQTQAVEDSAQAGKSKRITGFQTQTTPILLNVNERVELATDKYIPYTHILENIVLVKENPNSTDL